MTPTQITALEWAIAQLDTLEYDGLEMVELNELLASERLKHLEFSGQGDLVAFMKKWGITLPMKEAASWRMALPEHQRIGEICGLPESRGTLRATNGILCYIERLERFPYRGHVQHFVFDRNIDINPFERSGFAISKARKAKAVSVTSIEAFLSEIVA
jgi:hypothetical protein